MNNLLNDLKRIAREAQIFVTGQLPREIGKISEDHFRESFRNEGFTDESLVKWPEVERRKEANQGTYKNRKGQKKSKYSHKEQTSPILTMSGDLGDSISWEADFNKTITIGSDSQCAQIHNEGGMAGRGNKVKIPKRQFMGPSRELDRKIEKKIIRGVDIIFKYKK